MTAARRPGQRRHPRAPFRGIVTLWRNREPRRAFARDIGPGGIFLETELSLGEGALCVLRIALPGQLGFTVMGRAVRSELGCPPGRPAGIAVEFVAISARQRYALRRYALQHHAPASRAPAVSGSSRLFATIS